MSEKFNSFEIAESEVSGKKLAYNKEIKELISDNPDLIRTVLEALNSGELDHSQSDSDADDEPVKKWEKDGVVIESFEALQLHHNVYKVSVNNHTFFLKIKDSELKDSEEKFSHSQNYLGGFEEAQSTEEAREIFKDQPDVFIPTTYLGFTKIKNGRLQKYFVSEFVDSAITNLSKYMWEIKNDPSQQEYYLALKQRALEVKLAILGRGYKDIGDHNLAYDPENKRIIVFDLNKPNEIH